MLPPLEAPVGPRSFAAIRKPLHSGGREGTTVSSDDETATAALLASMNVSTSDCHGDADDDADDDTDHDNQWIEDLDDARKSEFGPSINVKLVLLGNKRFDHPHSYHEL